MFGAIAFICRPVWADEFPRTDSGKPNFEGVWDFRTATPLEAPENLGNAAQFDADGARAFEESGEEARRERVFDEPWTDHGRELTEGLRASLIVDPPDGRLPPRTEYGKTLQGKWRQMMMAVHTDNPEDRTVLERCIVSSAVPLTSSSFNNNIRIVQTPDHIVILSEMVHEARIASFDSSEVPDIGAWNGHSRAHWDGDTLVIDTTGFRQYATQIGTSGRMKIQERFVLKSTEELVYEYTVDDSLVFTAPWTARQTLSRTDGLIYEYACHERNDSMTAMLRGSRLEEQSDLESTEE